MAIGNVASFDHVFTLRPTLLVESPLGKLPLAIFRDGLSSGFSDTHLLAL